MKHEVETQWMGKMQFNALLNGHTLVMDAPEKVGGENNGPIPKPLVLTALSGCTGMDVIALLRKKNIELNYFDIKAEGELSKEAPVQYISIHLTYQFKGDDAYQEDALKAVSDSQEKYCGVSSMLKKIMPVTWDVLYNEIVIFSNKTKQYHDQ
jgi:putative redox protein